METINWVIKNTKTNTVKTYTRSRGLNVRPTRSNKVDEFNHQQASVAKLCLIL